MLSGAAEWLADVPVVDAHCHGPLLPPRPDSADELVALLGESRDPRQIHEHQRTTLYALQALRDLATFHECAPEPAAILAARSGLDPDALIARCVQAAGARALLVDSGYRDQDCYAPDTLDAVLAPECHAWPVLRIERLLEVLIADTTSFEALEAGFAAALADLRPRGYRGLKSIAAYRGGLALAAADRAAAAEAYPALRATAAAGSLRLTARPFLDYFLVQAFATAQAQALPVQIHTGFGDADLDLLRANPLLLRPALEAGMFLGAPLVLLHCYPYVREAAYLASLYADVYLDLSLTVPLVGPGGQRAVEEALELAPTSKLLYGSDAAGLAESFWLGATAMRRALGGALGSWLRAGYLTAAQADEIAERVLWRNAATLYALDLPGILPTPR